MGQSNLDVGVFQDTKLTGGIYTRISDGYKFVVTPAQSQHRSGVMLFCWDPPASAVELIRQFGVNIIACQMVMVERRWYNFRCYLAPRDG